MIRAFTGLILAWLLSGCAALGLRPPVPDLLLLPVVSGPEPVLLKQSVSLVAGDRTRTFLSILRINPESLAGTVMLPSGQSLLTYDYVDNCLTISSPLNGEVPLREFLAIMQFSLWPEAALRQHYIAEDGWTLVLAGGGKRELFWQGEPVLQVTPSSTGLIIQQLDKHYRIVVDTLNEGTDTRHRETDRATGTAPSL